MVFHDVTKKRKEQEEIRWQAMHDQLTGLNNRIGFNLILENLCKQTLRDGRVHSLLFMDLDRFKIINDTAGHLVGDSVLKSVSFLLKSHSRENDFLCRFGGDEFGLILINCHIDLATHIATKLIKTIAEYDFIHEQSVFKLGLSVGIATISPESSDPTTVLNNADFACYRAKDSGRNRFHVYDPKERNKTAY